MARIPLDEAIALATSIARPTHVERVPLTEVLGRVLAEDVDFGVDLPPFDYAAMDGYAIAGGAEVGRSFTVRGESRAGAPALDVGPGLAIGISTGAALPPGLDTVVPWEDVEKNDARITLVRAARAQQHVRYAGEDARRGQRAIDRGTPLGPQHVALLATLEQVEVPVYRRPRVRVLATGDELRDPGSTPRPGSIVDSNGPMLAALAHRSGASARTERIPDREGALEAALRGPLDADLVVTIGGAADGQHDHVITALAALGAETVFRGVAIRPGKPVALAKLGAVPLLALPGNPGSAYLTFLLIGAPLLEAIGGARAQPRRRRARIAAPLSAPGDRMALVYGDLKLEGDGLTFTPGPAASSGSVPGLARAGAIAFVPMGARLEAGAVLDVLEVA